MIARIRDHDRTFRRAWDRRQSVARAAGAAHPTGRAKRSSSRAGIPAAGSGRRGSSRRPGTHKTLSSENAGLGNEAPRLRASRELLTPPPLRPGSRPRPPHSAHEPSYSPSILPPASSTASARIAALTPEPQVVMIGLLRSTLCAAKIAFSVSGDFSRPCSTTSLRRAGSGCPACGRFSGPRAARAPSPRNRSPGRASTTCADRSPAPREPRRARRRRICRAGA